MPTTLQKFHSLMIVGARPMVTTWYHAPMVRPCLKVQTKEFGLESPRTPGTPSWAPFPKASELTETAPGVFVVKRLDCPEGRQEFRYDFSLPA